MADDENRFPPIPPLETLPFMRRIRGGYDGHRSAQIDDISAQMLITLNSLPDFAGIDDEAKKYVAKRMATHCERMYEIGIQAGIDDEHERAEAELQEARAFQRRVIGN